MKKLALVLIIVLFSFSVVYGEGETRQRQSVEISMMENPSEENYNGVWIPFLRYLRSFKDVVDVDEEYKDDYVLIYNNEVQVQIFGKLYKDLPYKFDEGAVVSAIGLGKKNPVNLTMRLLDNNLMLYSIGWDGEAKVEFICYQKGGL